MSCHCHLAQGFFSVPIDDDNVRLPFFLHSIASYVKPPLLHSNKPRPIALIIGGRTPKKRKKKKEEKPWSKEIQNFIDIWVLYLKTMFM